MPPALRLLVVAAAACAALACRSHPTPPPATARSPAAASTRLPQTADECKACRGDWGRHGLAEQESCNCRTNDGGKRCTDGGDCQGMCVASEEPEREQVEPGPPARGFFVGRCSELMTAFGCNRIIDRGARARGPVPLADPPQMICVD